MPLLRDEAILAGRAQQLADLLGVARRCGGGAKPDATREWDDHLAERRDAREARRQGRPGAFGLRTIGERAELDDTSRRAARLRFRRNGRLGFVRRQGLWRGLGRGLGDWRFGNLVEIEFRILVLARAGLKCRFAFA